MVKFGIYPPQVGIEYRSIREVVSEAEWLGFDSVWMSDHLMLLLEDSPFLEGWTTLSAIAAETKSLKLGTIVICNTFRHPSLLAKMAATLDAISGGRLILGMGAGWIEKEHKSYGIPFPGPSVRIEQLKESLQIIKRMWTEEKASFQGKYYTIREAMCNPKPLQRPHPPILIGGTGRKILEVVAELGDYCNYDRLTLDESRRALGVIEEHCSSIGRKRSEIGQSFCGEIILAQDREQVKQKLARAYEGFMVMAEHARRDPIGLYRDRFRPTSLEDYARRRIVGTPQQCIEKMGQFVDLGVDHFILVFPDIKELKCLEFFMDQVVPSFKKG
jgi:F420-dependent oxidoreductase-like protein